MDRFEGIPKASPKSTSNEPISEKLWRVYVPESSDVTEQIWAISVLNPLLSIPNGFLKGQKKTVIVFISVGAFHPLWIKTVLRTPLCLPMALGQGGFLHNCMGPWRVHQGVSKWGNSTSNSPSTRKIQLVDRKRYQTPEPDPANKVCKSRPCKVGLSVCDVKFTLFDVYLD